MKRKVMKMIIREGGGGGSRKGKVTPRERSGSSEWKQQLQSEKLLGLVEFLAKWPSEEQERGIAEAETITMSIHSCF